MPKIRRRNLPPALLNHLLDRINTQPDVADGKWFKRFSGMTVCGEGELVKTFLTSGQAPMGREIP